MKLENERYEVTIVEEGGEIYSFTDKESGLQYMWQGDKENWGGKNPTLFPIIGNTFTKEYEIGGKTYAMKNHGLIRYATLSTKKADQEEVIMELDSSEETLAQYPFPFHYEIKYALEKNQLRITYHITNSGTTQMPFTFGLHPGFNCPLCEGEKFEEYTLSFSNEEHMQQLVFDPKKEHPYELKDVVLQKMACSYAEIEKYATLIYKHPKSAYLSLEGPKGHGVRLFIAGYPYLAIWTAKQNAPFLCLEPWYGHGDFSRVEEDFYHREGTMLLSPGKTFTTAYTIEVF